jgi:hypothetical protein
VKINNFVPWRPVLKQLPPPRSKKLAAENDPLRPSPVHRSSTYSRGHDDEDRT